jgi:hypothetical protein
MDIGLIMGGVYTIIGIGIFAGIGYTIYQHFT